jgi:protein-disulfide isomerase
MEGVVWYQQKWFRILKIVTAVLFFLAIILIWLGFWLVGETQRQEISKIYNGSNAVSVGSNPIATSTVPSKSTARQRAEKMNRPKMGNNSAKLVLVEFADFQCPHCRDEYPAITATVDKYKDKMLFIYRNYPVIDQNSVLLAEAGYCAFEQNGFWPFYNNVFNNPTAEISLTSLDSLAKAMGLDADKFNDCLKTEKYKVSVKEDTDDATALGVGGTPTFFLNGAVIKGGLTTNQWDEIISKSLSALEK